MKSSLRGGLRRSNLYVKSMGVSLRYGGILLLSLQIASEIFHIYFLRENFIAMTQ
jgi:hypothetical protein